MGHNVLNKIRENLLMSKAELARNLAVYDSILGDILASTMDVPLSNHMRVLKNIFK